jgi:carboxyl-terminal processing protease
LIVTVKAVNISMRTLVKGLFMGRSVRTPFLIIMLLVLAVALIVINYSSTWLRTSPTESEFDLIEEAWEIIVNDYVDSDDIDLEKLSQGAIRGMIEALDDPYSAYFDSEQYSLSKYSLEGSFGGIGVEVTLNNQGELMIIAPIVGTPAYEAGLLPGDIILEIDGEKTEGMTMIEAVVKVRGDPGTQVTLSILHKDEELPQDFVIIRQEIELTSVLSKMLADNIAHIDISHFSSRTGDEMALALEGVIVEDATGIVLDLRNNPGGVLKSAVEVASQFVEDGVITYVIDGYGNEDAWEVVEGGLAIDIPLAVLINGNSASASEVVAGALQDHNRGIIIGTQTLGKGAVSAS